MTYEEALKKIEGGRNKVSRKVKNNTTLHKLVEVNGAVTVGVKLHDTFVVIMHPNHSVYFSGGYRTSTTKQRINEFGLCSVYQKNFAWYLKDGTLFEDGIVVDRMGVASALCSQEWLQNQAGRSAEIKVMVYDERVPVTVLRPTTWGG